MQRPQHVLLVPGFFGFANLGDFAYFGHIREFLDLRLRRQGLAGQVRVVTTYPTASLRKRAGRVAEHLQQLLEEQDGDVHLIGHSSGGLDARFAMSPGASLPVDFDIERYASRVKTVVSLSSPHHGSPLATFLASLLGRQILKVFSLITIYTLRTGRVPIEAVFHVVRLLALRRLPIAAGTLLNNVYRDLLADFSAERRDALEKFFIEVGHDQDLLGQIGPAGMTDFNQATVDRPGVRYGCVVTCVPRPGLRSMWATGLQPFRQSTHALFAGFHRITARMPFDLHPTLTAPQRTQLERVYGKVPTARDNDGMVPTLSQVWGDIVHATWGDHLDALGHFYLPEHVPPHYDWLNSGAAFMRTAYERMWNDVAGYLFRHASMAIE
jgi:hypothetical protein